MSDGLPDTIEALAPLLRAREVSPTEVTRACLRRAEALNGSLHAYVTLLPEAATAQAEEAERELRRGEHRGPLHGIPVSVKDVIETRGVPTTWGAAALASHRPAGDATVVAKLRDAGAILLGKANVDMFPYDGSARSRRMVGATRNPWDTSRTAGRSSGGSAAAVAAGFDYGSIGTDNGGSIRIPSAVCGVVGLKPTFGRVSKHRILPYSVSFDHPGPIARGVYDCAALLGAIAGHDAQDPATVDRPVPDYVAALDGPVRGLRVGVPSEAWQHNDPDVMRLVDDAVMVLTTLGLTVHRVEPPPFDDALWVNVLSGLETAELAERVTPPGRADGVVDAYMAERSAGYRARLMEQGGRIKRAAEDRYAAIFEGVDVMVLPTVPAAAPLLTEDRSRWERPGEPFVEVPARYTRLFNLVGYPAISVPCGLTSEGLPAGLQIAGRPFDEPTVLRVARAYERATAWHGMAPPAARGD